jgi:probable rRNA maturation factor
VAIAVRNRQRLVKVNTRLLRELAGRVLSIVTDCWARSPQGFAPRRSQTSGGQPFGLPALQDLSIVLVNDKQIAKLNAQYHATPAATDILSFDYGNGQGELIISVEHAIGQAKHFRSTPARELVLYVIHGILHLHGYNDTTPRRRVRMRAGERRLLNGLHRQFRLAALIGSR